MAGTKLIKNIDTTELILLLLCILVARFDFSWGDAEFHQETLENLRAAVKKSKKLCAVSSVAPAIPTNYSVYISLNI